MPIMDRTQIISFHQNNRTGAGVANKSGPGAMSVAAAQARPFPKIKPAPSASSLYALDAVNLFLAAMLSGFGPYVAAFLASQNWSQQKIGFVLTAAGLAGLASQIPGGELLDKMQSKRMAIALGVMMIAASALIMALRPAFPLVIAALLLQAITGGFLGLAIACISLGLAGHAELGERLGRNQRFASTGGVLAAGLLGVSAYYLSYQVIFFAAAALVVPLMMALSRIQASDIHYGCSCGAPDYEGPGLVATAPRDSLWRNGSLLTFAICLFLFQMANASMLPLAAEGLARAEGAASPLLLSALIVVPQLVVALMAPWAGHQAKIRGRRPLLLIGFSALPVRALLFAFTTDPAILIAAQLLDGITGTILGVLTALTVADIASGSGRFNFAQGFVGAMSGLGASLSTALTGGLAGSFGRSAGFGGIAAAGLAAVVLLWLRMPETSLSEEHWQLR
jgi:MFS family permease